MEVVKLLGVEQREYVDKATGEVKIYRALHVMHETPTENVTGNAVSSFTCPKDLGNDRLLPGRSYELVYTHFPTKNGLGAKISDLKLVKQQ